MNNGYSLCLNQWALDKDIKNELGLLLIISSLCAEKGFCWATNKYLADIFDVTEQSISNKLKKLEEKKYIQIEYERRGCEVIKRTIRLSKIYIDDIKIVIPTIEENFKENNININNTNINNKKSIIINNNTKKRELEEEFEEVWKLYPKKKGKTESLKKYIKVRQSGIDKEIIINGINNYKKEIEIKNTDVKYIKNGSTWFNQECWNDEYEIVDKFQEELEKLKLRIQQEKEN